MSNKRKALLLVIIFIIAVLAGPSTALGEAAIGEIVAGITDVESPAAYLVDQKTGHVLFAKQGDEKRAVASTTKIITALVVLEYSDVASEVTISDVVASTNGATIGLKAGEKRTVRELLNALMVASANDAAVALAEHTSGSESEFVILMNQKVQALGAESTRFINPHGLASGNVHFSTAADLSKLAMAAMKEPAFRELVSTRSFKWETTDTALPVMLTNSNHLLGDYPLATGIKTGYTRESGYCLVGSATKGERSVITVILGSPSREISFNDARKLLNWGLNNFGLRKVVSKDRRYKTIERQGKTIPLVANRTIRKLMYTGTDGALAFRSRVRKGIKLPVDKGEELGNLSVSQLGRKIGTVELVSGRSVAPPYITENLSVYFWRVVKKMENLVKSIL